jgi:hypothetical protein
MKDSETKGNYNSDGCHVLYTLMSSWRCAQLFTRRDTFIFPNVRLVLTSGRSPPLIVFLPNFCMHFSSVLLRENK